MLQIRPFVVFRHLSTAKMEASIATITMLSIVGGSINVMVAMLIQRLPSMVSPFNNPNYFSEINLAQFLLLFLPLLTLPALPFLLAPLLAKLAPSGRIVPIIDIQVSSFAFLLITFSSWNALQIFMYPLFTLVGGIFASQYGASFVGYPVDPNEVEVRSTHVWLDWKQIKEHLESPDIADTLALDLERTETKSNEVTFMNAKGHTHPFFLRIIEHLRGHESMVYLFCYEETKYGMAKTPASTQYIDKQFDYFRGLLDRWNPPVKHEDGITIPNRNKTIEDTISGKVSGASLTLWRLTKTTVALIVALLTAEVAIPLYFFIIGDFNDGLVTVAVVLVSIAPIVQGVRNRRKEPEA